MMFIELQPTIVSHSIDIYPQMFKTYSDCEEDLIKKNKVKRGERCLNFLIFYSFPI